jgi:N6-adenosine-specific RNA methylase IME4
MTCGAKHPKNREVCTRDAGHVGIHSNGGNVTWKEPKSKAPEPAAASEQKLCGNLVRDPSTGKPHKGVHARACARELGHEGVHRIGPEGEHAHVTEWNDHTPGCVSYSQKFHPNGAATPGEIEHDDEDDDPYEDEVRSDADRDLARKLREDREAHAAEIDLSVPDTAPIASTRPAGTVFRGVMVGMRRRDLKVHPAADLLPMMEGEDFDRFVTDIQTNGMNQKPVLDHAGDVLVDGRNRMRACERLGIDPEFEFLPEGKNLTAYVISASCRRNLTDGQKAAFACDVANLSPGRPKQTRPGAGFVDGVTQAEAAAASGSSVRSVQRANSVRDRAVPELWAAVKSGKVDLKGAEQLAKLPPAQQRKLVKERIEPSKSPVRGGKLASLARQEEKREIVRKINTGRVAPMPVGPFGVIYADYPWKYENSDQHEGSRGHMGYPPMTMDEIVAHARDAAKRAGDACVIALWVTNLHIPNIGRVVEAYGAEHHTMLTWPKPRAGVGSWPRGQTEHLVLASIGKPVHTLNEISTLLPSWSPARPGEHSSKPAEVAELLTKHCAGPHLELFGRDQRDGWIVWGAEVDKFAATEAA